MRSTNLSWVFQSGTALAIVFGSLVACSEGSGGGDGDGADAGSGGADAGSGGADAGTGGADAGTGGADAGTGGAAEPRANCGDLTCVSGEVCVTTSPYFGAGDAVDECRASEEGCPAWNTCECASDEWAGGLRTACAATVPPALWIVDLSCGDVRCGETEVCLIDDTGAEAPACVPAPDTCEVNEDFCDGDCGTEVAAAAGMDHVSCRSNSLAAGVRVSPTL